MSPDRTDSLLRRLFEHAFNEGTFAVVDELLAPGGITHTSTWGVPQNREGFKQLIALFRSAFPDLKMHTSIEHLIAEGDYVVARITFHYTNAGKEATGSGLSEYRLANGKIVEDWPPSDSAALLQQVGVTLPSG